MTYTLQYDAEIATVWDGLPQGISEQLTTALAQVCDDPISVTAPYGEDDGIMRLLILGPLLAVLYLGHQTKTVRILQISHTG